jgi:DNA-directed RNA polymerase specialized sigma24 family protein
MEVLEQEERQLLEWSFVDGLKQREIAARMGKNVKQIGSELNRAEEKLRRLVNEKTLSEKKNLI